MALAYHSFKPTIFDNIFIKFTIHISPPYIYQVSSLFFYYINIIFLE